MNNWFKDSDIFFEEFENKFSLGYQIQKGAESYVSIENSIVLIGLDQIISDSIRKELYKTSFPFQNIALTDLGNIRNTSPEFIIQALKQFDSENSNLLILGSNIDTFELQLKTMEQKISNIAFVEKSGDIFFNKNIQEQILNSPNISKAGLIAYQTHLLNPEKLNNKKFNNSIRLGKYRNNYQDIEPVLRNIDTLLFNMDSIRYSEVPGIKNTTPSGLTSEEACQIMKYTGLNNKYNIMNFIGYEPKYDFHSQGAMMISQLIWYYIEGVDQQVMENISDRNSMISIVVDLSDYNLSLSFIQSKKTGRWWVEIPNPEDNTSYHIACSEDDYNKATRNELSNRIFNELSF